MTKSYGEVRALNGISFSVESGECFGILGPNGAGKTTLMRLISAVSRRSSGSMSVLGMDPEQEGSAVRARIGVVPQEDCLEEDLTVRENLYVFGRLFGISRRELKERIPALVRDARLEEKVGTKAAELSGGMRRRLTIARALISGPDILLLDEPSTGLDPQARQGLWEELFALRSTGMTQIVTTHYMDEAEQLCDRIAIVDHGTIISAGTPSGLIKSTLPSGVVELRGDERDIAQGLALLSVPVQRVEKVSRRLLLFDDDVEAVSQDMRTATDGNAMVTVRRTTLEDVFLALTGRELRET
ncbi:ABC transporter ATP-binding protein [Streptomyces sp. NPDC046805]|uniref:ABC transporter ATP-binding protein n=1 Tax=Streptomyces sp. NPDC046805 TaxID=3155134 RepID=UPI0033FD6D27